MQSQSTHQHQWLQQLVGDWTFESECPPDPQGNVLKSAGTERVIAIGDLWIVCEGAGEMEGHGLVTSRMALGYDPAKSSFVGTWIGSVMSNMFIYEGSLDKDEKVLTLNTPGPDFEDPSTMRDYRDVITITGHDTRELRSYMKHGDDWTLLMTGKYHRSP